jgi:geranylgeranyl pyrophosphate synthase
MSHAIEELQRLIESALLAHLPQCGLPGAKPLDDALHYVMFPGGKRLRPILSIMGARIFNPDPRPALGAACAVEFIHASSLIFDDLPCMDDAAIRRGLPVVHKVYGEEVAWLAGIALLNQAYALFGKVPALIHEATYCIGVEGMIGGQALDLAHHDDSAEALLVRTQNLVERNRGKPTGQDLRHHRPSHSLLDDAVSFQQLNGLVAEARQSLTVAYGSRSAEVLASVDAIFNAQILEASQVS